MCIHNGTVYRSGSAMSTSSLCSYCYCFNGQQKCIKPKCFLPTEGCRPVLSDSSCCPIRYDCSENAAAVDKLQKSSQNLRRSDNKHYLRLISRTQRSRGIQHFNLFSNLYIILFKFGLLSNRISYKIKKKLCESGFLYFVLHIIVLWQVV